MLAELLRWRPALLQRAVGYCPEACMAARSRVLTGALCMRAVGQFKERVCRLILICEADPFQGLAAASAPGTPVPPSTPAA